MVHYTRPYWNYLDMRDMQGYLHTKIKGVLIMSPKYKAKEWNKDLIHLYVVLGNTTTLMKFIHTKSFLNTATLKIGLKTRIKLCRKLLRNSVINNKLNLQLPWDTKICFQHQEGGLSRPVNPIQINSYHHYQ